MSLGVTSQPARGDHVAASLGVLRGFELRCDDERVAITSAGQRLLALLALHDRPISRSYVAGTLWGDLTDERAAANLRSALWRLRQLDQPLIDSSCEHIALSPDVAVDFWDAAAEARRVCAGAGADADHWTLAYDLLPDWYDDWVVIERERFRHLRLHALELLSAHHAAAGRFALAVDAAVLAVAGEPLRESAQRALIAAHLAEGNVDEADRQYRGYCELLHSELGVAPTPALADLVGVVTRR